MNYLGDVTQTRQQRLLSYSEIAGLLARHPIVAARVAETKATMLAGLYDFNYYDLGPWVWRLKFPGIIEPIGMEVEDSTYGRVLIQPAPDGEIYFSGWIGVDLGTDTPTEGEGAYVPPEPPCGDWLSCLGQDIGNAVIIGGVLVVGIYLFSHSGRGANVSNER